MLTECLHAPLLFLVLAQNNSRSVYTDCNAHCNNEIQFFWVESFQWIHVWAVEWFIYELDWIGNSDWTENRFCSNDLSQEQNAKIL